MRACKLNPRCIDYELASHKKTIMRFYFVLFLSLMTTACSPMQTKKQTKFSSTTADEMLRFAVVGIAATGLQYAI